MVRKIIFFFSCFLIIGCLILSNSCRKDKGKLDYTSSGYPQAVGTIIVSKCATLGCHTNKSKDGSAGISLETWDDMFAGGKSGACCIPYSHEYSTIFLFTNTDPAKGPVNMPSMPLNHDPLSADEMKTLTDWIDAGAPNANGKIMWADNTNRKKFYVTNQGCDVVTVFDQATLLQMRYIPVGITSGVESPHMLKLSPDEKYWYISFLGGTAFQKFSTSDDSHIGDINVGVGSWNTFTITNNSQNAFIIDWNVPGKISYLDLTAMNIPITYQGSGLFDWPHGSMISSDGKYLYATANKSNFLYKTDVSDPMNPNFLSNVSMDGTPAGSTQLWAHDLAYTPDSLYYFVTCEKENTVRAFKSSNDSLVAAITVGKQPVELSFSKTTSRVFVSCMDDDSTAQYPNRGSISIIDYSNYQNIYLIKNMKDINIAEPHGIGVDDEKGLVYVANRNLVGPAPHHSTSCGKPGFISFIDLNTLNVLSKTIEVAHDPYSIAVRH